MGADASEMGHILRRHIQHLHNRHKMFMVCVPDGKYDKFPRLKIIMQL